jgi:hypothetical protein
MLFARQVLQDHPKSSVGDLRDKDSLDGRQFNSLLKQMAISNANAGKNGTATTRL